MGKNKRNRLASLTREFVGKQYELGNNDCFIVIYKYLQLRGLPLPRLYKGQTLRTYAELFLKDPHGAKELMVDFIDNTLKRLKGPNYSTAGDILFLRPKSVYLAPAALGIDCGNGNVMIVTEKHGVNIAPLNRYEIVRGWTCQLRDQ